MREIEQDAKEYGDERRTLIEAAQRTTAEVRIAEEPVTVIVSQRGWVRARQGHGHDAAQFAFKAGDALDGAFEVLTTDQVFVLASNGRVHSVPVSQMPSARGDGAPITTFVELEPGARVVCVFAAHAGRGVLFSTRAGNGFTCLAGDLVGRTRQGKQFMTLDEGDLPLRPALFAAGTGQVACISEGGRLLAFPVTEVKALRSGGRGVILMGLEPKEALLQAVVHGESGLVVEGMGRGGKPIRREMSARELAGYVAARARKGRLLEPRVREARLFTNA